MGKPIAALIAKTDDAVAALSLGVSRPIQRQSLWRTLGAGGPAIHGKFGLWTIGMATIAVAQILVVDDRLPNQKA
jgi:hypothetical protein